jgi:hypothetical protein
MIVPGRQVPPCRGCGSTAARPPMRQFCFVCRNNRCSSCHRIGNQHHPLCPRVAHRCRACGVRLPDLWAKMCTSCRDQRCPSCNRLGGTHRAGCRGGWHLCLACGVTQLIGRPRGDGEVPPDLLASVIARCYRAALTQAARIAGHGAAQDVVQEAALRCWLARPRLAGARYRSLAGSLNGYFLTTVQHCAAEGVSPRAELGVDPDRLEIIAARRLLGERGRRIPPRLATHMVEEDRR